MVENNYEALGPLMKRFGDAVTDQLGAVPKRAYIFAYCEDNWAQISLHVEDGDVVRSYDPSEVLFEIASEIWSVDNADRPKRLRWIYFNYDIAGGRFRTHFFFPEEIAKGTEYDVWEETAVKERFGDKPIVYHGFPADDDPPRP